MAREKKYKIVPAYKGKVCYTIPPEYDRPDGGKFVLDESLTDDDLAYLAEVIGYEGVTK